MTLPASPLAPPLPLAIQVNGQPCQTQASHLEGLLRERGHALDSAFACAVNNIFVPRAQWLQRALQAGDRVDVIAPITGG